MRSVSGATLISSYVAENLKSKIKVYTIDPQSEYITGVLDPLILDLIWPLLAEEKPKTYYSALIESDGGVWHIVKYGKVLRLWERPRPLISLPNYLKLLFALHLIKGRETEKDILEVLCYYFDCNVSFLLEDFDKYSHFYFSPFRKYIPKQYLLDYLCSYLISINFSKDALSTLYEFLFCAKWQFPVNLFSWNFLSRLTENLKSIIQQ